MTVDPSLVLAALDDIANAQPPSIHVVIGAFDPTRAYIPGENVTYAGSAWYAVVSLTGVTPGTDITKWAPIATQGTGGNLFPDQAAYSATTYDGSNRPTVIEWWADAGHTIRLLTESLTYDGSGNATTVVLQVYVNGALDHTLTDTVTYNGLGNETARARVRS